MRAVAAEFSARIGADDRQEEGTIDVSDVSLAEKVRKGGWERLHRPATLPMQTIEVPGTQFSSIMASFTIGFLHLWEPALLRENV